MTYAEKITLTTIDCVCCAGTYAINEVFRQDKQERGGSWRCPYCANSVSYTENENSKLRKQLAAKAEELQREKQATMQQHAARVAAEQRAAKVKCAEKGVCPHCRRSFTSLRRHMSTAHGIKNGESPKPAKLSTRSA